MRQILSDIWPAPAQKTDPSVTVVISLAGCMPEMPWRKQIMKVLLNFIRNLDEKARNDLEDNNVFWDRLRKDSRSVHQGK